MRGILWVGWVSGPWWCCVEIGVGGSVQDWWGGCLKMLLLLLVFGESKVRFARFGRFQQIGQQRKKAQHPKSKTRIKNTTFFFFSAFAFCLFSFQTNFFRHGTNSTGKCDDTFYCEWHPIPGDGCYECYNDSICRVKRTRNVDSPCEQTTMW